MKIIIESYKIVYVFVYKDETTKLVTPKLKQTKQRMQFVGENKTKQKNTHVTYTGKIDKSNFLLSKFTKSIKMNLFKILHKCFKSWPNILSLGSQGKD